MNADPDDERPSKSARKRELSELLALAEQMVALSDTELSRLDVDAPLRDALALVRPMRPSGARNRQLKHCVRFMDGEALDQVRAYLDDRQSHKVERNRAFHEMERWRDRLIEEGDEALQELLDSHPNLDRQHLRRLCRDATRERDSGSPRGAGRRLFRELRDALLDQTAKN